MNEPKLRFKADDGSQFPDWEEKVFGDFVDTHLEKTSDKDTYPLYSLTIESGVQPKTDRYEREFLVKKEGDNYKIVPPNAFVYNPMNLRFGALKVNHEKFSVSVSGYYDVFSLKDDSVLAFWENYLVTPKMLNYYFSIATGSLIEKLRVHYSQFVKIKKPLPSLPEQQKIAEFLSTIDTVIAKQKETVSAWEERKKGVMQKLFSQEVRFKADDGSDFPEWEEKKLGDITSQYKARNKKRLPLEIYSVNNIVGFIPQSEQFDDAGYLKDTDTSIYMIVPPKHFAYNPARLDVGSIGYQYLDHDVQVSSLYEVFETSNLVNDEFLWSWLHTQLFNNVVKRLQEGGVRLYFYYDKMQEVKIELPSLPEQQKIADCLSSLDEVIEKQKATLSAWEELKKGLLQQMFV